MQLPLQISFRNMPPSEAVEASIRRHAEKLEHFTGDIISCRVIVEPAHKHHRQGNLYHVRVDVKLPGTELVTGRERDLHHAHEDVYVAIRDAFEAMKRRIEDQVRLRRGQVKHHESMPSGHVTEISPEESAGRIETPDGRSVYFHGNSLIDADFRKLEPGTKVRFAEEMGEQGPRATMVHVIGKGSRRRGGG